MDAADGSTTVQRKRLSNIKGHSELAHWAGEMLRTRDAINLLKRRNAWQRERVLDLMEGRSVVTDGGFQISVKTTEVKAYAVEAAVHLHIIIRDQK